MFYVRLVTWSTSSQDADLPSSVYLTNSHIFQGEVENSSVHDKNEFWMRDYVRPQRQTGIDCARANMLDNMEVHSEDE
jgi:hypothetical protein